MHKSTVIRNIHPIGQGGFASEYHVEHNKLIIYDCGYMSPRVSQRNKSLVYNNLPDCDIEVLFISHYDHDHISLIPYLKQIRKIKNVVIPLVPWNNILSQLIENEEEKQLMKDPRSFFNNNIFDNKPRIIRVKPFNREPLGEIEAVIIDDNSSDTDIPSGRKLIIPSTNWEYIPFNIYYQQRSKQFQEICSEYGINNEQLSDADYLFDKSVLKNIKDAYKRVDGGINQNSMIVYSGITQNHICSKIIGTAYFRCECDYYFRNCHRKYFYVCDYHKPACLYTGDWDCSEIDSVFKYIKDRKNMIGLIQIPHHGAKNNFNDKLIIDENMSFFVQFGNKNPYGHPSLSVLSSIACKINYGTIYKVTENGDSALQQIITI